MRDQNGIYDKLSNKVYDIEHWLNFDIYGLQNVDSIFWQGELNLGDNTDIIKI